MEMSETGVTMLGLDEHLIPCKSAPLLIRPGCFSAKPGKI
jgi:hypothetical protein